VIPLIKTNNNSIIIGKENPVFLRRGGFSGAIGPFSPPDALKNKKPKLSPF
jgi:hypothetical protein